MIDDDKNLYWALTSSFPIVPMSREQFEFLRSTDDQWKGMVFETKNEAIDNLIEKLEKQKDLTIRIEKRKCPVCGDDYSEFGGLRTSSNGLGKEFVMVCNNRECDHELICAVRSEYDAYMNQYKTDVVGCQHEKDSNFYAVSDSTIWMTKIPGGLPAGMDRTNKCKKCGEFFK